MTLLQSGIAKSSAADAYTIDQSLRFDDGSSPYLSRTFGAGNQQVFTVSSWVKLGPKALGTETVSLLSEYTDGNNRSYLVFGSYCRAFSESGGSDVANYSTDATFRDPSAWYHVVFSIDVTQSTAADRVKIYVNGVEEDITISTNWPEDTNTRLNGASIHYVGQSGAASNETDGYLAEYHFIDGQALAASSFGETDSTTNQWKPIEYSGTYGTNGFYQKYASTELANSFEDSSSSDHTITANGHVANTRAVRKIGDSSIIFDGTGDYLSIPDSSDWNFGTSSFCMEGWVYRSVSGGHDRFMGQRADGSNRWYFDISTSDNIGFYIQDGGSDVLYAYSTGGELPHGAWHHLAATWDGTTFRMFVDGTSVTLTTATSYAGTFPDIASILTIGVVNISHAAQYFEGYMDEIRISNTARYTANFTTFGQDGGTIANPTPFTADSYTKLLIHSDWTGGLGADSSGNYNKFDVTNLTAYDQVLDSPSNNWCTINPITPGGSDLDEIPYGTITEGNLKFLTESTGYGCNQTTMATPQSGKWYCEFYWNAHAGSPSEEYSVVSAWDMNAAYPTYNGCTNQGSGTNNSAGYQHDGAGRYRTLAGSYTQDSSYGDTIDVGDLISIALDVTAGKVWYAKNGTWQNSGNPATGTNPLTDTLSASNWMFGVSDSSGDAAYVATWTANFGQDSSFAGAKTSGSASAQDANGKGDFFYTPPTDFLALCTDNLSTPEIALPGENFNTVLYTGNGVDGRAITGVGFQPDWLWIKKRDATGAHTILDVIRGTDSFLESNTAGAAETSTATIDSFDSDGFTVTDYANTNQDTKTFVAWNWKAGGAGVTNTDGTISGTVTVSANPTAGFSIVKYTGTGSNDGSDTVGHGLGVVPEFYVIKNLDGTDNWNLYTKPTGTGNYMYLDGTAASASASNGFQYNTIPSSSVFTLGTWDAVNKLNDEYIAYCFASIEGYSKVGSYTGNGNADGAFIYTGFKPEYVMSKYIGVSDDWRIMDTVRSPYNVATKRLYANTNAAEFDGASQSKDFLSNGFKIRTDEAGFNASGGVYLYLAFAESPFKYSNAR